MRSRRNDYLDKKIVECSASVNNIFEWSNLWTVTGYSVINYFGFIILTRSVKRPFAFAHFQQKLKRHFGNWQLCALKNKIDKIVVKMKKSRNLLSLWFIEFIKIFPNICSLIRISKPQKHFKLWTNITNIRIYTISS